MILLAFVVGFYLGAGMVTTVVVQDIDGEPSTWKNKVILAITWPLVLIDAGGAEDE